MFESSKTNLSQIDQTHQDPALHADDYSLLSSPHFAPRPLPDSLLIRTVRRRWRLMLIVCGILLAVGLTFSLVFVHPTYQAVAQLRFVPRPGLGDAGAGSDLRAGYSGYLATELARISRQEIVVAALGKLNLSGPSVENDLFRRTATVLQGRGWMVSVVVSGHSPDGLVQAANAVAQAYLDHDIAPQIQKHEQTTQRLRDELESFRGEKKHLLATLSGRNTEPYIRALDQRRDRLIKPLAEAREELSRARNEHSQADARLAALKASEADSRKVQALLVDLSKDDPLLEMYQSIYRTMIADSDQDKLFVPGGLSGGSGFSEKPAKVRKASAGDSRSSSSDNEATIIEQIHKGISERLKELKAQALQQGRDLRQTEIAAQQTIVQAKEQIRQDKKKHLERLLAEDEAGAKEITEVRRFAGQLRDMEDRIQDHEKLLQHLAVKLLPPAKPVLADSATEAAKVSDYRWLSISASVLLAALLSLGAGSLVEHFDSRLSHAGDIIRRVGVPVLASLPSSEDQQDGDELWLPEEISMADYVNDQYRNIRTAVLFGQGKPPRTIVVTAPTAAETKTTLSVNLAISIARSGRTVLLVDADLDNPALADVFDVSPAPGWSEVLRDPASLEQATCRTRVERLSVMPAGSQLEHSAELLSSPSCAKLLESLCQKFEHLIIDGPALLDCPEGRIIAALADGVICSFSTRSTRSGQARQARTILEELGASVIGSVLNS